jgi:hypothetical protein
VRPVEKVLKTTLRDLAFENSAAVEAVVRLLRASSPASPIIRPETYDSGANLLSLVLATCTSIIGLVGLTGGVDNEDVFAIVLVGGAAWWLLTGGVLLRGPLRIVWRLLKWRFSIAWGRFLFPNVDDWPERVTLKVRAQKIETLRIARPRFPPITVAAPIPADRSEPRARAVWAHPTAGTTDTAGVHRSLSGRT